MKNLKLLGKELSKAELKNVIGGFGTSVPTLCGGTCGIVYCSEGMRDQAGRDSWIQNVPGGWCITNYSCGDYNARCNCNGQECKR